MKKQILKVLSFAFVGLIMVSCSKDDDGSGETGVEPKKETALFDVNNLSKEDYIGTYEVIEILHDNFEFSSVGKLEENFGFETTCEEKPLRIGKLNEFRYGFDSKSAFSSFGAESNIYTYDNNEKDDNGNFISCDLAGKKEVLDEKWIQYRSELSDFNEVVVENNIIYFKIITEKQISSEKKQYRFSVLKFEFLTNNEVVKSSYGYSEESEVGEFPSEITDLSSLTFGAAEKMKKTSNSVNLKEFNNGKEEIVYEYNHVKDDNL